jgi:hypothetical protein
MPSIERYYYGSARKFRDTNFMAWYIRDVGPLIILNVTAPPGRYPDTGAYFEKESGRIFRIDNIERSEDGHWPGICNDIDGGPLLIWQFNVRGGFAFCQHQAIDLIESRKSGWFDRIEPKYTEKKKKLFQMIDNLKPDDNPVVMVVKLKRF